MYLTKYATTSSAGRSSSLSLALSDAPDFRRRFAETDVRIAQMTWHCAASVTGGAGGAAATALVTGAVLVGGGSDFCTSDDSANLAFSELDSANAATAGGSDVTGDGSVGSEGFSDSLLASCFAEGSVGSICFSTIGVSEVRSGCFTFGSVCWARE